MAGPICLAVGLLGKSYQLIKFLKVELRMYFMSHLLLLIKGFSKYN